MRNFDVKSQFEAIKKSALRALNKVFPVKGKTRTLKIENTWVDDKADPSDYKSQSSVKSRDGTWGVPIYASVVLMDNATGKVLDRERKIKMFNLPKITNRFSYIVKGNEYQVDNQLRLKPGVYTTRKQNGELKTQVNLAKGKNFDIAFNESKGLFTLQKIGGGQANIPLYPLLVYLGVSPSLIAQAWGQKLEAANKNTDPKIIERIETAFGVKEGGLKDYFGKNTKMSAEVTKTTLGKEFSKVDGPMLLESAKALLNTHLGKREPDDRDSLEFKDLHSVEDFIQERIEKNKSSLAFKIARGIDNPRRTKVTQIVNPSAFNSTVEGFFTTDDKSNTPEQTNPLDMLSGAYSATIMGSGGIGTERAVTPAMREIHPTHYGIIDPIHSPEAKVGVNLHLTAGAIKDGKNVKMALKDKEGKPVFLKPKDVYNSSVAFPGQETAKNVKVMHKGKVSTIPRNEVDYFTPHPMGVFSPSTNLIPYLSSDQGNRAMMASKMLEQAIALKNREEPLVQVGASKTKTMEQVVGGEVALKSPYDGVVSKIDENAIYIRTKEGTKKVNRYNNFVLNSKSFLHHEPKVKKGDRVQKGDLLADSNYTKNGTLALGINLRTAYVPYKGQNFDDGIVITESAAEKLTSEHIYKKHYEKGPQSVVGLTAFKTNYPNAMTMDNANKLDSNGIIKKGSKVNMGDIIISALRKKTAVGDLALLSKKLSDRPKDDAVRWTMEDEGTVMDVQQSAAQITVFIKTEEKAKVGDKLAGRHGNKGVITSIIPDGKSPHDKDGNPVEMLLNPNGVISRINIGQTYESAAAKAALKDGKPHVVYNFTGENNLKQTENKLKSSKVDDKETLINPETGKPIGKVHVGNPYTLKLVKQSTSNYSVRQGGPGTPYDPNMQPLKAGGEESSKNADLLTMYSMLSNGARANLREMAAIKSTKNDEFWKALKSGQQLPPPKSPYVYDKFIDYLKGSGINVEKNGTKLSLAPLTDKQVLEMSSGAIEKPMFYRAKDLQPIKGGLFDPNITGGIGGEKWSHIPLKEPILNPVFETAARKIIGKGKKLDGVLNGTSYVDDDGEINTDKKGVTGGAGIERLLKKVNVSEDIKRLEEEIKGAKGPALDAMNKKLRYLMALKKSDLKPEEAYMRKVVPVVPPVHRPIYPQPNGAMTIADVNHLYHSISVLNNISKLPVNDLLPDEEKANLRKDMYHHAKGLSGITDVPIKGRERKGFISEIKGGAEGQPKQGMFISKLLSKKQDFVGRGTIIPDSDLSIDEMAMPQDMAWKLFEPFLIRELRNHGKTPLQAQDEIKNRTELARRALELVMKERKVLLNRAPSLHKFSIMAFKPKITDGKSIKIPPLVNRGFNADHDGDTMTLHLPITDEANKEADGMMPSRNLFQPGSGKLMIVPSQEAQVGLYYLSKTPQGRRELNKHIPAKHHIKTVLNKKETHNVLKNLAQNVPPNEFGVMVSRLKAEGEKHAYERGFTLGVNDLAQFGKDRDKIVNDIKKDFKGVKSEAEIDKISKKHIKRMDQLIQKKLKDKDNPLYDMIESGAKGSPSQLRSLLASPLLVTDAKRRTVRNPIRKSYAEGLDMDDYWTSMYGARRGMMDRALQTSEPGAFSKDILAATVNNVVSKDDCGTKEGILLKLADPDVLGRYLAGSQGGISHNTLVDSSIVGRAKKAGLRSLKVRSPLRCVQPKGTCSKCYGLDEHSQAPSIGDNIGAKAGQTIAEPLVQLIMNSFHTGGTAGGDQGGYGRIHQLLHMPKVVVGAAALAPKKGVVTDIKKGLAGGWDVTVAGETVHVAKGLNLKVRKGQRVSEGDPLSEGVIKPQDLVKHKGMNAAQDYIAGELQKAYNQQGVGMQRKVFETVVRSLGNTTKVVNNPKDSDFVPGDVAPYTVVNAYNKNLASKIPTSEAVGHTLNKNAGMLKKGRVLTQQDVDALTVKGVKEVEIKKDAIKHVPILKGITGLPLLRQDWMATLGYRNLAKSLTEGAGQGWTTDLAGYHPIPAFAHGATFGQGEKGKY